VPGGAILSRLLSAKQTLLLQRFLENSAAGRPEKVALVFGESRLTYGPLDVQANRLARFLRNLGVQRQDRVAILLDSSVESVVSLFGVLKADAVFLMLSPALKTSKLAYILSDCGVKALITHTGKAAVVCPSLASASCVEQVLWVRNPDSLDKDGFPDSVRHHWLKPVLADEAVSGDPPPTAGIDLDLATIIYTSGSTGSPKRVMLTHLNMVSARYLHHHVPREPAGRYHFQRSPSFCGASQTRRPHCHPRTSASSEACSPMPRFTPCTA